MNSSIVKSVKIRYGDEVRRVNVQYFLPDTDEKNEQEQGLTPRLGWSEFVEKIFVLFHLTGENKTENIKLKYQDNDGDMVTVSSNFELAEAFRTSNDTLVMRMCIPESESDVADKRHCTHPARRASCDRGNKMKWGAYWKNMQKNNNVTFEQRQQQGALIKQMIEQDEELTGLFAILRENPLVWYESKQPENNKPTTAVHHGAGGGKFGCIYWRNIVHLHKWFEGETRRLAVVEYLKEHPLLIKDKLPTLLKSTYQLMATRPHGNGVINKVLYSLLELLDNIEGEDKEIIVQLCDTVVSTGVPVFNNTTFQYNSTCYYSIIGNTQAALRTLNTALELGYNNWEQLLVDKDLENLRTVPQFTSLITKYTQCNNTQLNNTVLGTFSSLVTDVLDTVLSGIHNTTTPTTELNTDTLQMPDLNEEEAEMVPESDPVESTPTQQPQYSADIMDKVSQIQVMGLTNNIEDAIELLSKNNNDVSTVVNNMFK